MVFKPPKRKELIAPDVKVSIIVPTFNRSHLLAESLSSLVRQSLFEREIIVVDDGSTDDTREVALGFGSDVRYLFKPNGGKASALNYGLRFARGEDIWVFDDDDVAEPDALERLREALSQRPECGFSYGAYSSFGFSESGERWEYRVAVPRLEGPDLFVALLERCFIFQGSMLVRKRCLDEVGLFDETLIRSQDYDMLLRLAHRFRAATTQGTVFFQRANRDIRGTRANPIKSKDVERAWAHYDRRILQKILPLLKDADYLPTRVAGVLTDAKTAQAKLQKSCILLRKGMWPEAISAVEEFVQVPRLRPFSLELEEIRICEKMFDTYSRSFVASFRSGDLRSILNKLEAVGLKKQAAISMSGSLVQVIRIAIRHRDISLVLSALKAFRLLRGNAAVLTVILSTLWSIVEGRIRGDSDKRLQRFSKPTF